MKHSFCDCEWHAAGGPICIRCCASSKEDLAKPCPVENGEQTEKADDD